MQRVAKAAAWVGAVGFVTFLILNTQILRVEGDSMAPTIRGGDFIAVCDLCPARPGDIVVVHFVSQDWREYFVKRLVATSDQTVYIRNGVVYINGTPEAFGPAVTWTKRTSFSLGGQPARVPRGWAFVLGDNRNESRDSRELGFAKVVGRVVVVFSLAYRR
ncbi:MAG: signal peptidase I [Firmicutes bacterium]|nr:signal peptidase I [Bacillota bacterium]